METMNRTRIRLRSLVDVRPGEWSMALLMFLLLFFVIGTFAVVKPVRSSLFLKEFGAKNLPYVYLATALLAGLVAAMHSWLFRRHSVLKVILLTYGFFAATLVFFWYAFQQETLWLSALFFLWTNVFTITLNTLFWIFANNYYNPREAKRLYGFINAGGTVGGIAGGFTVSLLVARVGTENLLLWCAVVLGVSALLTATIYRLGKDRFSGKEWIEAGAPGDARAPLSENRSGPTQRLFASRYPRYIAGALGFSLVVSTLVDYQFNSVVERTYQQTDAMTAFFGSFSAWTNALTFVLQFFLTAPLLRRLGIGPALLILPTLMLTGALAFPLYPVLATALFLKISDSSVRYSIEQSTRDVLYLPLSNLAMKRLKAFIDVFVQRLAKGVGSLLILSLTEWLAFRFELLSYLVIGLAGTWLFFAWALGKEYVAELKKFLTQANLQERPKFLRHLDQAAITELLDGLVSGDATRALYCLELLESERRIDLRPILRQFVRSGSPPLQARALHLLAEAGDDTLVPDAERILQEGASETKEEAIHYLCATHAQKALEKMQQFLHHPDDALRAAALACMVNCGDAQAQKMAREFLEQMVRAEQQSRILAAKTLGHLRPPSVLHALLVPLLQDESVAVVRAALEAAEKTAQKDLVPLILAHLGKPETSAWARRALLAHGEGILDVLRNELVNESVPLDTRMQLPRLFAEVGSPAAAQVLLNCLPRARTPLRHEIVLALSKLKAENPELQLGEEALRSAILREAAEAYRWLEGLHSSASHNSAAQPGSRVREKSARQYNESCERIFLLLDLLLGPGDILSVYHSLHNTAPELRGNALELLDNILPAGLKAILLPLVDDSVPVEERLRVGRSFAAKFRGRNLRPRFEGAWRSEVAR